MRKKTKTKFFILILFMVAGVLFFPNKSNAYVKHSRAEAMQWIKDKENKEVDYDTWMGPEYKNQCTDLIYAYYDYLGVEVVWGNAETFLNNKLPDGWYRTNTPTQGDIVVWEGGKYRDPELKNVKALEGFGHVGIVWDVTGDNEIETFENNGNANELQGPCRVYKRNSSQVSCYIHPDFFDLNIIEKDDGSQILSWDEYNVGGSYDAYSKAAYYKVKIEKEGNEIIEFEEHGTVFDCRKLSAGIYKVYVEAYNKDNIVKRTTAAINIVVKGIDVKFKDSKFEKWMVAKYDENKDGKIQTAEIPSEIHFEEQDMFKEFDFDDCTIVYPEDINWINSVCISSCANVKASQFKGMQSIPSINSLGIYSYVLGVNNIDELLSYFPNVKKLYIGGKYHPGSGSSTELIENCDFLDKFNGLKELSICYTPSEKDVEHILKHKDSLTYLYISGELSNTTIFDKALDYTKLGNLEKLNNLRIELVNLQDGLFINKMKNLKILDLESVTFKNEFNLSSNSIETLSISCDLNNNCYLNKFIFDNVSNVKHLDIIGNYSNGANTYTGFDWNKLSKFTSLKNLNLQNYHITDLSFLNKLTSLENIYLDEIRDVNSLPNLEDLNNLREFWFWNGDIVDVTKFEKIVNMENFKILNLEKQDSLNPNSNENQKIFDIINKRKETDNTVSFKVDNYIIKDFVDESKVNVKNNIQSYLGLITLVRTAQMTEISNFITIDNFPILETYDIKVKSDGETEKSFDQKLGSKDTVQIINTLGEVIQEYIVIVPGDVTGNGEVKLYDTFKILNDVLKKVEIDAIDTEIRDYNEDGIVNTYDALQYMKQTMKE